MSTIDLAATYVTGGRLLGSVAAITALTGAVIGILALARPAGRRPAAALLAGLAGLLLGSLTVATADGGPGTGGGIVGGFAALGFGLIAVGLGGVVLARRRTR